MNMKKILASVAASALALTSLATVASAASTSITFAKTAAPTYEVTITATMTSSEAITFDKAGDKIVSSLKAGDSVDVTKDGTNKSLTISAVTINGVTADASGAVTVGLTAGQGLPKGTSTSTFTVVITAAEGTPTTDLTGYAVKAGETLAVAVTAATQEFSAVPVNCADFTKAEVKCTSTPGAISGLGTAANKQTLSLTADAAATGLGHKLTAAEKTALKNATSVTATVTIDGNASSGGEEVKLGTADGGDQLGKGTVAEGANSVVITLTGSLYDATYDEFVQNIYVEAASTDLKAVVLTINYDGDAAPTPDEEGDDDDDDDDDGDDDATQGDDDTDTDTDTDTDDDGGQGGEDGGDDVPATGVALAVIPAIVAASGVIVFKKRK